MTTPHRYWVFEIPKPRCAKAQLMLPTSPTVEGLSLPVGSTAGLPQSPANQFWEIFLVFVVLGTLVGVVVVAYMLKNAYVYRYGSGNGEKADVNRPELGEKPSGSGGGKKLFLSFGISAVIVLSLIVWTYSALLYVEDPPDNTDLTVDVEGQQFAWKFTYENGKESFNTMRLPANSTIRIGVTSADVFHNFGIPAMKVKADAIPGQTTDKWFVTEGPGTYLAQCYELCGSGHSGMDAEVIVMPQDEFQDWYTNGTGNSQASVTGEVPA
ncbi:MAG: cytochrome c oxidase subunit II [Salinirussus sp.]